MNTTYQYTYTQLYSFFAHMTHYLNDNANRWMYIENHTSLVPSIHTCITGKKWTYHSTTNTLSVSNDNQYRVDWLSASMRIHHNDKRYEYPIDDFIATFRCNHNANLITLYDLYLCFCVYYHVWFPANAGISCFVITSDGEEDIYHEADYITMTSKK